MLLVLPIINVGFFFWVVLLLMLLIRYNSDPKVPLYLGIETITINGTDTYAITCEKKINII